MLPLSVLAACVDTAKPPAEEGPAAVDSAADTAPADTAPADTAPADTDTGTSPEPVELDVQFLGVGGFHLRAGDDALLTAPLYSNPDLWTVTTGAIASDPDVIDRFLPDVSDAKAILVGHAHYDHLLDVPWVRTHTDDAIVYGNTSVQHLLAAFAPDPPAGCEDRAQPAVEVPTDRVVAVDDFFTDVVDYRNCGGVETCSNHEDDAAGEWIDVPRTRVRIRALCSEHPDQFAFVHFGEGCVDDAQCEPPGSAEEWREGTTVAWLVDFLDDAGAPTFRIYYQDAPTNAPIGFPAADLLAEKGVDLALLNAGNYDQVEDHPGEFIREVAPRYVIMGHWEDFFRTQDEPVEPIPFEDVEDLRSRLEEVLPGGEGTRWWIPMPGDAYTFEPG